MPKSRLLSSVAFVLFLMSCDEKKPSSQSTPPADPLAQEIVDKAIQAHGGAAYQTIYAGFDFREKYYSVQRLDDRYIYTREFEDSTGRIKDVLVSSSKLTRTVNGDTVALTDEWHGKYLNSVNSVLYFALLPYGLNDAAVKKKYLGETTVKGKAYHKIEVTFQQQGGGKDFEDVFVYWFAKDTYRLDYLAYYYNTDETGIRFREAYNQQVVDGVVFQDYVNYKPADSTSTVYDTDSLFEKGLLTQLSKIENENLKSLK